MLVSCDQRSSTILQSPRGSLGLKLKLWFNKKLWSNLRKYYIFWSQNGFRVFTSIALLIKHVKDWNRKHLGFIEGSHIKINWWWMKSKLLTEYSTLNFTYLGRIILTSDMQNVNYSEVKFFTICFSKGNAVIRDLLS